MGKPSFAGILLTDGELAVRLNASIAWIEANRDMLRATGFPEAVASTGERWDAGAIQQWQLAMRSMERVLSGPPPGPLGELLGTIAWCAADET
jgi:hypothetical protein